MEDDCKTDTVTLQHTFCDGFVMLINLYETSDLRALCEHTSCDVEQNVNLHFCSLTVKFTESDKSVLSWGKKNKVLSSF